MSRSLPEGRVSGANGRQCHAAKIAEVAINRFGAIARLEPSALQIGRGGERQATLAVAPATRRLLLVAVRPELLEVGPKVGDVFVVLYADEGHSRAGHLLHRRTDVFRERFVAPGDPGPLVGGGVIEALETASLAAVDGVEGRPKLDFGRFADVVAGGAKTLEHLLAGSGILRQGRARRSCKSNPSNHPRPHHFLLFPTLPRPVPAPADRRPDGISANGIG